MKKLLHPGKILRRLNHFSLKQTCVYCQQLSTRTSKHRLNRSSLKLMFIVFKAFGDLMGNIERFKSGRKYIPLKILALINETRGITGIHGFIC